MTEKAFDISKRIKELVEAKKLSVNKLAGMAGMTQPTLQLILDKNDARLSQIVAIAGAIGVSVAELIGLSAEVPSVSKDRCDENRPDSNYVSLLEQLVQSKDDQVLLLKKEVDRLQRGENAKVMLLEQELHRLKKDDQGKNVDWTILDHFKRRLEIGPSYESGSKVFDEIMANLTDDDRHRLEYMASKDPVEFQLESIENTRQLVGVIKLLKKFLIKHKEASMSDFKELLKDQYTLEQIKYMIYKLSQPGKVLEQFGVGRGTKYRLRNHNEIMDEKADEEAKRISAKFKEKGDLDENGFPKKKK